MGKAVGKPYQKGFCKGGCPNYGFGPTHVRCSVLNKADGAVKVAGRLFWAKVECEHARM